MDPLSGQNRGYAFITYCTRDAAQAAVKQVRFYLLFLLDTSSLSVFVCSLYFLHVLLPILFFLFKLTFKERNEYFTSYFDSSLDFFSGKLLVEMAKSKIIKIGSVEINVYKCT